jgi:Na+/proline symporter
MKGLIRVLAVLCLAIGAFLIYAVINAASSSGGANVPVCIGYVIGAALLAYIARWLWTRPARRAKAATAPAGS